MTDFTTWTDSFLIKTLNCVTRTMLDIEEGKMKVSNEQIQKIGRNAHAMTDEVERRGLEGRLFTEAPDGLRRRLKKRGIK